MDESRTNAVPTVAPPRRILLLALLPIGDTLFATPTMRALKDQYPRAQITALVHTTTRPLLQWVPGLDEVIVLPVGQDWQGLPALLKVLRYLRAQRFDVSIDLTSPAYKWVNFVCGIPLRTYMKFDPLWFLVPSAHRRWRSTHATRHYFECARELRLPPWEEVNKVPRFQLPESQRESARLFLQRQGIRDGGRSSRRPIVVIHPGGAGLHGLKRWPAERFSAVCARLQEDWGAHIVILGGPEDAALAESIAAALPQPAVVAAGKIPLLTSIAVIEASDLFIGNDSSPLHFAAALGTPYVAIFGPTCLENFRPVARYANQGRVVMPVLPCPEPQYFVGGDVILHQPRCQGICRALATVTVADVLGPAEELLEEHFLPVPVLD